MMDTLQMVIRAAALPFALLCLLSACGAAPTNVPPPQPTLDERPTATPLPEAPAWRQPSAPISLQNIPQISLLGRLEAPGEASTVFAYALSPDNTRLAALNHVYFIVWDLVTGEQVFYMTRQDETRVYYSPDKDEIYTVGASGAVYIVNSETGAIEEELNAQTDYNNIADYHADRGLLALASTTGEIKVWDMFQRVSLATLSRENTEALSLSFSTDGEWLAAGYADGGVAIWNWQNRQVAAEAAPAGSVVGMLRFTPDDHSLVGMTASGGYVWNPLDGAQRHALQMEQGGSSTLFKFIPGSSTIIVGGLAGDATLWNIETGRLVSALPGIGGNTVDAAFSPDGMLLFTSVYESGVTLWNLDNLANGTIARSTQPFENQNILNLLWTDDSFLVLMIDARGPIEVWGIP
jgi:WD40 repeat protein